MRSVCRLTRETICVLRAVWLATKVGLLPGPRSRSALAVSPIALASAPAAAASAPAIARSAIFTLACAVLARGPIAVAIAVTVGVVMSVVMLVVVVVVRAAAVADGLDLVVGVVALEASLAGVAMLAFAAAGPVIAPPSAPAPAPFAALVPVLAAAALVARRPRLV